MWPIAMMLGVLFVSNPILALYDSGALGASPVAPMTYISIGALALSIVLCFVLRAIVNSISRR
jgi:hypothetical protein